MVRLTKTIKKLVSAILKILAGSIVAASVLSKNFAIAHEVEMQSEKEKTINVLEDEMKNNEVFLDIIENEILDEEADRLDSENEFEKEKIEQEITDELITQEETEDFEDDCKDEEQVVKDVNRKENEVKTETEEEGENETEIETEDITLLEGELETEVLEEDFDLEKLNMYEGVCGDEIVYSFEPESGKLIISGTGQVFDYEDVRELPWGSYFDDIKAVELEDGVTVKLWMINKKSAQRANKY